MVSLQGENGSAASQPDPSRTGNASGYENRTPEAHVEASSVDFHHHTNDLHLEDPSRNSGTYPSYPTEIALEGENRSQIFYSPVNTQFSRQPTEISYHVPPSQIQHWLECSDSSERLRLGLPRFQNRKAQIDHYEDFNYPIAHSRVDDAAYNEHSTNPTLTPNPNKNGPQSQSRAPASETASRPATPSNQVAGGFTEATKLDPSVSESQNGKRTHPESIDDLENLFEESKESQLNALMPQTSEAIVMNPARTLVPGENMPFDMVTGRQTTAPRRTGRVVESRANIHANLARNGSAQSVAGETAPQVASSQNSGGISAAANIQKNVTQKNTRSSRRNKSRKTTTSRPGDQRTSMHTAPPHSAGNPNLDNSHADLYNSNPHIGTPSFYSQPLYSLGTENPLAQSSDIAMSNVQSTNLLPDTHPQRESVSNFFHTCNPMSENALQDVFSPSSNPQFPADGLDSLFLNDMGAQDSFENLGQDTPFQPNYVDLLGNQNSQHSQFSSQSYNEIESGPPGLTTNSTSPESDHLSTGLEYVQPQSLSTPSSTRKDIPCLNREAENEWWKQFVEDS